MADFTRLERRILCVLEEAREEELCTLTNSVARAQGAPLEIEAMRAALLQLMHRGMIELATTRDDVSRRWVCPPVADQMAFLRNCGRHVRWSAADALWKWSSEVPPAQILLTDSGAKMAEGILSQEGWPEEPLDSYE